MRHLTRSAACAVLCGLPFAGCMKDEPVSKATTKPTTMTSASATTKPTAEMAEATSAAVATVAEKDMTHEVTAEAPIFTSIPAAADAEPAMTLKPGDKVLVMVPRGKYVQVTTIGGVRGYVATSSLKPLGG